MFSHLPYLTITLSTCTTRDNTWVVCVYAYPLSNGGIQTGSKWSRGVIISIFSQSKRLPPRDADNTLFRVCMFLHDPCTIQHILASVSKSIHNISHQDRHPSVFSCYQLLWAAMSEYCFTSLSAQSRQSRDKRKPEVRNISHSNRMTLRLSLQCTFNYSREQCLMPLNSLQHCDNIDDNIRPSRDSSPVGLPLSHNRTKWGQGINPLSPHDASFYIPENLIFLQPTVLEQKILWNWLTSSL